MYKKAVIPQSVKSDVWKRECYPLNQDIASCRTCGHVVRIPQSLIHKYPFRIENLAGYGFRCAEFGHIKSEYYGGSSTDPDNLTIQCKPCNVALGSNDMVLKTIDVAMIPEEYNDIDLCCIDRSMSNAIEIDGRGNYCSKWLGDRYCRGQKLAGQGFCHVHLG